MTTTPLYLDWTFWNSIAAGAAVLVSLWPYIKAKLGRRKVSIELNERLLVSHMVGHANAMSYIALRNVGTKAARLTGLRMTFSREGRAPFSLDGMSLFLQLNDEKSVIFVSKTLTPGEEWGHTVHFAERLSQYDDRTLGEMRAALRVDIGAKATARDRLPEGDARRNEFVRAEEATVRPLIESFDRAFKWEPGEYQLTAEARLESGEVLAKRGRFTLYPADTAEMRGYVDDYWHGFGAGIEVAKHAGVFVKLTLEA